MGEPLDVVPRQAGGAVPHCPRASRTQGRAFPTEERRSLRWGNRGSWERPVLLRRGGEIVRVLGSPPCLPRCFRGWLELVHQTALLTHCSRGTLWSGRQRDGAGAEPWAPAGPWLFLFSFRFISFKILFY